MKNMDIENAKRQLYDYKDFYGGELISRDEIETAKSEADIDRIIDRHRQYMNDMLSDAESHLNSLSKRIGLWDKYNLKS